MKFMVSLLMSGILSFSTGCANAGLYGHPLVGKKAIDFKLALHKGGEASLNGLRKGGGAVLFFWSTWCPHCRTQIKEVAAQKAALEKIGVVAILVDIGETAETVEKFLKEKGYDFNVMLDTDSSVAEAYQVMGVPTIVFIGADGNIRDIENGFPDNYAEILK